jgi:phosphatidylserine decarboxylase
LDHDPPDKRLLKERTLVTLLRWAPKGSFSSIVGALARQPLPRGVRTRVYTAFARRVGADLSECERPLEDYASLDEFFTRRLRAGARPMPADEDVIVSPCDGAVSEFGTMNQGRMIQVKGHDYRLASLVPDTEAAARFVGGTYVTIYLAPRDYHRVHFCASGRVSGFQHIPGSLFPVNALSVRHVNGLFTRNERIVTYHDSAAGEIATVMVAATGVGNMTLAYENVETHRRKRSWPLGPRVRTGAPRPVRRGDDLGAFHLGSTVILLFEPGRVKLEPMSRGQRVLLGQPIGRRAIQVASSKGAA